MPFERFGHRSGTASNGGVSTVVKKSRNSQLVASDYIARFSVCGRGTHWRIYTCLPKPFAVTLERRSIRCSHSPAFSGVPFLRLRCGSSLVRVAGDRSPSVMSSSEVRSGYFLRGAQLSGECLVRQPDTRLTASLVDASILLSSAHAHSVLMMSIISSAKSAKDATAFGRRSVCP